MRSTTVSRRFFPLFQPYRGNFPLFRVTFLSRESLRIKTNGVHMSPVGGGRAFGTQLPLSSPDHISSKSLTSALSLDGKVTVITGGARGVGLSLAQSLASIGSEVAILDILRPEIPMEDLQNSYGVRVKYFKFVLVPGERYTIRKLLLTGHRVDVSSKDQLDGAFRQVIGEFGRIDNCVTCAGIALDKPFLEHTWEESRKILEINVLGSFFCAQNAARQMVHQGGGGSIVMVASIAAHCAIPSQRVSIYGASKGAIKLLGKTLAVEMAPFNIRVNTISPGFIRTDMSRQFTELQEVFRKTPPLRRIGEREDLSLAVAYLLCSSASYTTGADIAVTGGLHNGRIDT